MYSRYLGGTKVKAIFKLFFIEGNTLLYDLMCLMWFKIRTI